MSLVKFSLINIYSTTTSVLFCRFQMITEALKVSKGHENTLPKSLQHGQLKLHETVRQKATNKEEVV